MAMERIPLSENSTGTGILLLATSLLCLGVVIVNSALASVANPGAWYARVDFRHSIFAIVAFMILLSAWRIDYRLLARGRVIPVFAVSFYALSVLACVAVLIPGVGHKVGGDARWIRIAPNIGFQPTEIIRFAMVILLSAWLTRPGVSVKSFFKTFVPASIVIGLSCALVIKDDFGVAVLIGLAGFTTLLLAGVPWWQFLTMIAPAVAACYVLVLKVPHRMARITAFLNPWDISNETTFQSRESLLAILTGGWYGKGVGEGCIKLGYLPERSTDFIFAVYCEEWGFIGAILLMSLVLVWIYLIRQACFKAADGFGRVLAGSLGIIVAMQAVLHIGVDTGALPPTGMSFPFISAGGTALIIMAGAVATIVSVTATRSSALSPAQQLQALAAK